jgi:hypothetical protein
MTVKRTTILTPPCILPAPCVPFLRRREDSDAAHASWSTFQPVKHEEMLGSAVDRRPPIPFAATVVERRELLQAPLGLGFVRCQLACDSPISKLLCIVAPVGYYPQLLALIQAVWYSRTVSSDCKGCIRDSVGPELQLVKKHGVCINAESEQELNRTSGVHDERGLLKADI